MIGFGAKVYINGKMLAYCDRGLIVQVKDGTHVTAPESEVLPQPNYRFPVGATVSVADGREGIVLGHLLRLGSERPFYDVRVIARETRCGRQYENLCYEEAELRWSYAPVKISTLERKVP